jgi:peptidoglycan L-alanyl-D-glutamate endopeptidase CwlK
MSNFKPGPRSLLNLRGVDPRLVKVIHRTYELTTVDITVVEGLRAMARQKELVAQGASQTLDSRHITGHAVDVAPYVGGRVRWDWPLFFPIIAAVREAAIEQGVTIRWGGCWDRMLNDLDGTQLEMEVAAYSTRCKAAGKKVFVDGPHIELPRSIYG